MADDIDDLLDEVETKYVDRKKFAAGSSNRHRTRLFFLDHLICCCIIFGHCSTSSSRSASFLCFHFDFNTNLLYFVAHFLFQK